jgi:hypothetical protein
MNGKADRHATRRIQTAEEPLPVSNPVGPPDPQVRTEVKYRLEMHFTEVGTTL